MGAQPESTRRERPEHGCAAKEEKLEDAKTRFRERKDRTEDA